VFGMCGRGGFETGVGPLPVDEKYVDSGLNEEDVKNVE